MDTDGGVVDDLTNQRKRFTTAASLYDITSNSLQTATCRQIKCRLKATKPLDLSPLGSGLSNRSKFQGQTRRKARTQSFRSNGFIS